MSPAQKVEKAGIEEWLVAAEVLSNRLTECVHTYKHATEVFMSESERQHKTDMTIKVLQRLHALLDQSDTPVEMILNIAAHDERIIAGFETLFREALRAMPWLSTDMQKLLKSPWMKNFTNKAAEKIFIGEGEEWQGIGSGCPEHGRLPGVLASLLDREQIGDTRPPRKEGVDEPSRHDKDPTDRWNEQNAGYLRTAGKIQ